MTPPQEQPSPRVLLVAEHASARFGGEAVIPLHIFRKLRQRGLEAWMVVHERTRGELEQELGSEVLRVSFVPDTQLHKLMHRLSSYLPAQLAYFTVGYISRLSSQIMARRIARRLVAEQRVTVVHQPIPVSPREPSLLYNLGVPVVIGPLNGGMSYPPGFRSRNRKLNLLNTWTVLARKISGLIHYLAPGKRQAATLLVANERTRNALPTGCRGKVVTLIENGVDLSIWLDPITAGASKEVNSYTHFVFMGRLIDLKAVDLLLEAFKDVVSICPAKLSLLGDGPMRPAWEAETERLGLQSHVTFAGWRSQKECAELLKAADVLVLPSLHEAGGAVILEAMASGIPVIATNWGGPADYLDDTCGILIDPLDRDQFIHGFAQAMLKLAQSPDVRQTMGDAARKKVVSGSLNWDHKIDVFIELYKEAIYRTRP